MRRTLLPWIGLTIFLFAQNLRAQERYSFYQGVRQMGMGGASVAVVNDETALLLNPAALGKLRDSFLTIADPEVEIGSQTMAIAGSQLQKMGNPQAGLDATNAKPNEHLHERVQMFPSFVMPNFGIGVLGKYQVDAQVNSTTNKFTYDYTNDYAVVMGFDWRFWGGVLKIGANARLDNRTQVLNSNIDPTSTNLTLSNLAGSGVGVGTDAGMILTAPVPWLPTLAAVYRDIGNTAFTYKPGVFMQTTEPPAHTPSSADVGLAIHPILARGIRSSWTVEYQDVTTVSQETDQMRRVHAGFEFNFNDSFFLRGGLNQRYWTAGLEFDIENYQFQLASYGEDIGVPGTPVEDRRYDIKFSFRF